LKHWGEGGSIVLSQNVAVTEQNAFSCAV